MSIETLARQLGQLLKSYVGDAADAHEAIAAVEAFHEGFSGEPKTTPRIDLPVHPTLIDPRTALGMTEVSHDIAAPLGLHVVANPRGLSVRSRARPDGHVLLNIEPGGRLVAWLEDKPVPDHNGTPWKRFIMEPHAEAYLPYPPRRR